jgi:hypothetical protein
MAQNTVTGGTYDRNRNGPVTTIIVDVPPLSITSPATLPQGNKTTPYSYTLQATGGWGTKTWSVDSGSVPTGLSLDSATGVLSGTPSAHGTFGFRSKVSASGYNATKTHSILINQFPLSVTIGQWPVSAKPNVNCVWTASASGGTGSYTYTWYKSGNNLGGGSTKHTNVGGSSFWMRVTVSDGVATASDSLHTTVTSSSPVNCLY